MELDLTLLQLQKIQNAYRLMSVAQSHLDGITDIADGGLRAAAFEKALIQGNLTQAELDRRLQVYRDEHNGNEMPADDPQRHGNSALTSAVAAEVVRDYELLLYKPNDPSGFSGVLLKAKTGELIVVPRDTEFAPSQFGGDRERDLDGADIAHLTRNGAAYGQIESAKKMLDEAAASGLIPAGAKLTVVAGSLSGSIFLTLQKMNPELFVDTPEAHILINPAGLGVPRWHESFYAPGQTLDDKATYQEMQQVYTDLKNNPSLAYDKMGIFADDLSLNQLFHNAQAAPAIGPDDCIYDSFRDRFAATFVSKWFGVDLPKSITGADTSHTYSNPSVLSVVQKAYAGPDGFFVTALGHQPDNRFYIPIASQPFLETGGLYLDYGNNHTFTLGAQSVEVLIAFKTADPSLTVPQIGLIMQAASTRTAGLFGTVGKPGTEGDMLANTLDYLRDAVSFGAEPPPITPRNIDTGGFGNYEIKNQLYNNAKDVQQQLEQYENRHIVSLVSMSENDILAQAARNDATGEAFRFALMRNSPIVFLADNYTPPQWAGATALLDTQDQTLNFSTEYLQQLTRSTLASIDAGIQNIATSSGSVFTSKMNADGSLTTTEREVDSGKLMSTTNLQTGQDANGNIVLIRTTLLPNGDRTVELLNSNGQVLQRNETVTSPDGTTVETIRYADGRTIKLTYDNDGKLLGEEHIKSTGQILEQSAVTLLDALKLINAIQSGEPLPVVTSGLRLLNDLSNLNDALNLNLSGAASAASSILSLMSLNAALKEGDALGALTAGAQVVTFGATAYANFLGQSGDQYTSAIVKVFGADGAMASIEGALPYLSVVNSLVNGDYVGAAVYSLSALGVPYIGWAYAVYSIVDSLFSNNSAPKPQGNGLFVWNGDDISYYATGKTGGYEAVTGVMNGTLSTLNALIELARQGSPDNPLGIIPNRMPSVGYDMSGYRTVDIDPLTGVEKHPELRFDTSGKPYNAKPGSPESYQSIIESMVYSALARGAIAPLWEVRTAKMQTDAGDPKAGLTEEERAGRDGKLAPPLTGDTQIFRPVVLDLDGDGIETTDKAHGVAFDVDDSGFLKQTAWIKGDDAFLVLDRNLNGHIDSGRELFSNGMVALGGRGLAGMAWVDANYDGKLTAADPVWNELKLWRDLNQDGQQDADELWGLNELGITELNYAMATFTQDGVKKKLGSPDLEADSQGISISIVPEGIVVYSSVDGKLSLIVTDVKDKSTVEANRDGIDGFEDVEIVVSCAKLLENDTLNGFPGSELSIIGLTNFRHGTGFIDDNGFVHFIPEKDYAGDAGFDYVMQAPNGQKGTARVDITLQEVNDAPTLDRVDHESRPVYGYTPVVYGVDGEGYVSSNLYVSGGNPIYEPYAIQSYVTPDGGLATRIVTNPPPDLTGWLGFPAEFHTTPISTEDSGKGRVVGADVDDPATSLTYEVVGLPQYGAVTVNPDGTFQYASWKEPGVASDRIFIDGQYAGVTGQYGGYLGPDGTASMLYYPSMGLFQPGGEYVLYPTTDVFQVKITDPHGASTLQSIEVPHYGPYFVPKPPSGGGKKPIAVDLDGNGFEFVNVDDSNVFFDVNGDGWKHRISWVGPNDGLLAYDIDGNGKIDQAGEISFARYADGAQTDLEGLRAFDSNGNGRFDAADEKWAKFGIWRDANQNGVTDPGEFRTLTEMGIVAVDLTSDGQFQIINGQTVHGIGSMTRADGSKMAIADVTLAYSSEVRVPQGDGTMQTVNASPFSPNGEVINGTEGNDLILGKNGNNIIYGFGGDDVIFEDGGNDIIDGGDGNDLIYSGADNDLVFGGAGNDVIYAGLGNDVVFGGDGDDVIFGEGGNDIIFGGAGNDLISGGPGNDVLSGDDGDDQIFGESGNDALFGGNGDDELFGMDGFDYLNGGAGNDLLDGGTGADTMVGGAGDDTYVVDDIGDIVIELADEGIDTVRASIDYALGANVENLILTGTANLNGAGNELDNVLIGNQGDNTLTGGAGNDTLTGGQGYDTYVFSKGDGQDIIDDIQGLNTIRFLDVNSDEIKLERSGNDLKILYGKSDILTIQNAYYASSPAAYRMAYYEFADGKNLTMAELLALHPLQAAGGTSNGSWGNSDGNTIIGSGTDDTLNGTSGADILIGGKGNDLLKGNGGDDIYVFSKGDGQDVINDSQGSNTIRFLDVNSDEIKLVRSGNDLKILYGESDSVTIQRAFYSTASMATPHRMASYEFADGKSLTMAELFASHPVHVADGMTSVSFLGLASSGLTIIGSDANDNTITGDNGGNTLIGGKGTNDKLTGGSGADIIISGKGNDTLQGNAGNDIYVFSKGDGQDVINDTQGSNTIRFLDVKSDEIKLVRSGDDLKILYGESDSVTVQNAFYSSATTSASYRMANYEFADGKSLTMAELFALHPVHVADGMTNANFYNTASAGLTIVGSDANDNIITGDSGGNTLKGGNGTNDKLYGGSGADIIISGKGNDTLQGNAGNDIYVFSKGDGQDVINDNQGSNTIRFLDVNSDEVTQLRVGNDLKILYGESDSVTIQNHFYGTAYQMANYEYADDVPSEEPPANQPPQAATPLMAQSVDQDSLFHYALSAGSFTDPDGDALTYTAKLDNGAPLPAWLSFDAATQTFAGTPANGDVGNLQVRVTATDPAGASASQLFALEVANVNDAPSIGMVLAAQTASEDEAFVYTLPADAFVDIDVGDVLSYTATLDNGDPLPAWLSFDAATRTFTGVPASGDVGNLQVRVTATDLAGESASQSFTLDIASAGNPGDNQAPITAPDTAEVFEDSQTVATGNVLANDHDPDGDVLEITDAGIRHGEYGILTLQLDGSYSYALDNASAKVQGLGAGETVTEHFAYLASDGTAQSSGELSVTIHGANDAPEVGMLLLDQQAEQDALFAFTLPVSSFTDIDIGDVLIYSATLENGDPLPEWLTFDAATQTFTGTPADGDVGNLQLRVTATDQAGASASQSFALDITADGDSQTSIAAPDTAEVQEDASIVTGNVLANDTHPGTVTSFQVNGDATIYTAGQSATFKEGTLTIDSNGDYTFTPAQDYSGLVPQVTYTTSSGLSSTLDITITPLADAPLITVELGAPKESGWLTIDTSNHTRTDQGFTVSAFKSNGDPGVLATFGGGIGVGRYEDPRENPGDAAGEIAYNPTTDTSEKLVVTFDTPVTNASVALRELSTQERALVRAYDKDNNIIFAETVLGNNGDTPVTIATDEGRLISRIEFTAPGMTWHANGNIKDYDDYVVKSISYESMLVRPINAITVTPTDIDYSEQVTGITVSIPDGVLLSAGTNHGNGTWTLPMQDDGSYACTVDPVTGTVSITGLAMWIPPAFSGEATVKVTATVSDRVVVGSDTLVDTGVFDSSSAMLLIGTSGDDILISGKGNGLLLGKAGNDIYVFSKGDGQDTIHDSQGSNGLRFLDVNLDEVTLLRSGSDLKILYGESDTLTIQNHFSDASCQMASYEFADVTLIGVDLFEMHGM
ncbi:MAG: putative Ig domain-containing protein [Azonexus sp.]|jgi:VCBS repeat-containing protein|uniref:putative Ig domain-containing protein n=1 Tax=Azonexus sp. TaxID=1872668 RepID=UPI00281F8CFE|nr:putative Ig domain-containing protein [Azonexus sp.]MDR0775586.1 putative Ig domain-containing protein [Azonexus sp.]